MIINATGSKGGGSTPVINPLSVTENGTYTAPSGVDGYSPVTVNVSGGGGGSVEESDVNFYDYDGTCVASYTAADALALDALPDNPSHDGLVAQGWNYTLAQVKAEVNSVGGANVGQAYVTDDGKTRIYCTLTEGRLSPYLSLRINGTVIIDWGDGSTTDTLTGTSIYTNVGIQHTYAQSGDYVIALDATNATAQIAGSSDGQSLLMNRVATSANAVDRSMANAIKKVEIGSNITLDSYAFNYCTSLNSISLPATGIASEDAGYIFDYCCSLKFAVVPFFTTNMFMNCYSLASFSVNRDTSYYRIRGNTFKNCYSVRRAIIPSNITSIDASVFDGCYGLASAAIPGGVTNIGRSAFSCQAAGEYHFKSTTPPTLGSNAFGYIPSDCKIYVPAGSLETYKTATNWSTYASYMIGE